MTATAASGNPHADRLAAAFARVSVMLENYAQRRGVGGQPFPPPPDVPTPGAALDLMRDWFELSDFELAVVVLAAGGDLSVDIGRLCALAHGDATLPFPTVALALAVFAAEAGASHAAFAPDAPLRRFSLIELGPPSAGGRLQQRLVSPEALSATLTGAPTLDSRLAGLLEPVTAPPLLPSERCFVDELVRIAVAAPEATPQIAGPAHRRALDLAAAVAAGLGCAPYHLPLARLAAANDRDVLLTCWQRDRIALGGALLVSFDTLGEDQREVLLQLLADDVGPLFLIGPGSRELSARAAAPVIGAPPPAIVPDELSAAVARDAGLTADPALAQLVRQFRLPRTTITSCARIAAAVGDGVGPIAYLRRLLRDQVRESMSSLADRVEVRLSLDDLVLPTPARATLDQIVARQRNRTVVLDDWGFGGSGGGPQGMSVVFSGPSGTGKTMAAEALAHALALDLYRIDLSRIVDKYIGETEKRLTALFEAASASDAVLLFDEADVLFGRRTEVRDSHDRYANLEVAHLLQLIERFSGVAILTTNLPNAIDEAFARRFAFSLDFAFPGEDERRAIWRRAIPASAPADGLDFDALGRLALTGGQIRVVSVNAAMLAADADGTLTMAHVARALEADYAKQRRRLPAGSFDGWDR